MDPNARQQPSSSVTSNSASPPENSNLPFPPFSSFLNNSNPQQQPSQQQQPVHSSSKTLPPPPIHPRHPNTLPAPVPTFPNRGYPSPPAFPAPFNSRANASQSAYTQSAQWTSPSTYPQSTYPSQQLQAHPQRIKIDTSDLPIRSDFPTPHSDGKLSYSPDQKEPMASSSISRDDDSMPATSDFVKKLYKMLEDPSIQSIVAWSPQRDSFIVKDMTEFTKIVLPRLFKHSNFASFVRQLNKYDFHKVKNPEDSGEHSWTFRHPDFQADNLDALENIKRKVPSSRPATKHHSSAPASGTISAPTPVTSAATVALPPSPPRSPTDQSSLIDKLLRSSEQLTSRVEELEHKYSSVLSDMVSFQKNMAVQDGLMQNLIGYFIQLESGKQPDSAQQQLERFIPSSEASKLVSTKAMEDLTRTTLEGMNEMSRVAYLARSSSPRPATTIGSASRFVGLQGSGEGVAGMSREETMRRIDEMRRMRPMSRGAGGLPGGNSNVFAYEGSSNGDDWGLGAQPSSLTQRGVEEFNHQGLQVYTLGHLLPRDGIPDAYTVIGGEGAADPPGSQPWGSYGIASTSSSSSTPPQQPPPSQKLRVRRSTFVPGWSVPPRILLVDDDAVTRRLSSKFLQISGCTIDVAVDGVAAVERMNLEKYDLVLMDIVMPKLDGVSATNLIRQFDDRTPIISMTSNSKPSEIMTYYSSGMNDILPKPFTKEGLFTILERHLMHLKAINGNSVPSSPLPLFPNPSDDNDNRINPLAGLGLSDEQYNAMLSDLLGVTGEAFGGVGPEKRLLEGEDEGSGREGKRGRFEELNE